MKTTGATVLWLFLKIIKYLFWAAVAAFIFIVILLLSRYQDIKAAAAAGLAGKEEISAAVAALQSQNWTEAEARAIQGQEKFAASLASLDRLQNNYLIAHIRPLSSQVNDLEYLLKTAEILSRSLVRVVPLAGDLATLYSGKGQGDFSSLPAADKYRLLQKIYEAEPELNGLKANLDLAVMNLDKIKRFGVLYPVYNRLSDIKGELSQAANLLENTLPLTMILPILGGYPQASDFLIIFQNNDELRPSGGFIGAYGLLKTKDGEIVSLQTGDSYHIDMPAIGRWTKEPPAAIAKYLKVENWWFRDANWSPDWPTSAQTAQSFYNGEIAAVGQTPLDFRGIIGITPDFVADLISLVGPLTVQGQTYQPENFQELLQYNVEMAYKEKNISEWDRKDIINDLLAELKDKLFKLPSEKWLSALKIINQNIKEKNILLYFNDPSQQALADNLGISGRIAQPTQDYLMVVDANLAAFKTDAVVKKSVEYSLQAGAQDWQATVKLRYEHQGGFDWRTTRYRSYTRIYAPLGSVLEKIDGLDEEKNDFNTTDDWENNKTIFGFFFQVEPGDSREISVHYRLPQAVSALSADNSAYRLLVQKQPGRRTDRLTVKLNFNQEITASQPAGIAMSNQGISFQTGLEEDQAFLVNLK